MRRVDDGTVDVYARVASAKGDSALERLLRYMARSEGELEGFPALSARVQWQTDDLKMLEIYRLIIDTQRRIKALEVPVERRPCAGHVWR